MDGPGAAPVVVSVVSRKNRLKHFIGDGVWASVCDGAAESNFTAFASALTSSPQQINYLSSSQNFAGCWFQLWSDPLVKLCGGPKQLVVVSVSLQALILVAMVLMTFSGVGAIPFMVATFLFTACGGLAGPIWNSWVSALLPARRRGYCFGIRNQRTYPAQFIALLFGGGLLQWLNLAAAETRVPQLAFCTIFLIGLLAKTLSLRHLILQPGISYTPPAKALGPVSLLKHGAQDPEMRKALLFFSAMGFAVTISGPYQTPFMLQHLHTGYFPFAAATAAMVLARFLSATPVGRLIDRVRYPKPLLVSSLLMPLIPFGWTISSNFVWILAIQFMSGVIWTIFDLAVFTYLSEAVPREERQRLFSLRHISNNLAAAIGAFLGGLLISRFDQPLLVFWASTFARLGAALLVIPIVAQNFRWQLVPLPRILARKRVV